MTPHKLKMSDTLIVAMVLQATARHYGLSSSDLTDALFPTRYRKERAIAILLIKRFTSFSNREIKQWFPNLKSDSTIRDLARWIGHEAGNDTRLSWEVAAIARAVYDYDKLTTKGNA